MKNGFNETSISLDFVPHWLARNNPNFSMQKEVMYKKYYFSKQFIGFFIQTMNIIY